MKIKESGYKSKEGTGSPTPVTPGSFPLNLAPGVSHADQRDGIVLEVGQQPVTQTHLLHCSHRVGVAFHQPIRHLELDFMSLRLKERTGIGVSLCAVSRGGGLNADEHHRP